MLKRTHKCTELTKDNIGQEVVINGWVQKTRNKGSIIFTDVRDISGIMQVIFETPDINDEEFAIAGDLHSEYVVAVKGILRERSGEFNKDLKTGELEIRATNLEILSKSEPLPFPVENESKTKEELRLKYRYLDLRRRDLTNNLILRSEVCTCVRNFLKDNSFLEIETPILNRSTPEGARDYLVPSRVNSGEFYALPQSPQLFKQLLMCSGYDRYYQIAKCFRDEDLRADRQPEFTQIDMEMSFVDEDDVIELNSRLLKHLFKEILDIDIAYPIRKMKWIDAMNDYGIDKPDLRFDMKIVDLGDVVKDCGFGVFEDAIKNGGLVRGINAKTLGSLGRKQIDKLVDFVKDFRAKGLAYIAIDEEGNIKSSFAKFVSEDKMKEIISAMNGENGDLLLIVADEFKVVCDSLGNLRNHVADMAGLIDKDKFEFVWITDFPLFEYSIEEQRLMAMHHPFTMLKDEDIDLLKTSPEKVRAKAYDIVLNGCELGGGSVRINNPDIQSQMLEILGFTKERAEESFGFLLEAFKYGVPPHAGLAYGLDRLIMIMSGAESIRDVMAFPKNKDARCLMSMAPNKVDDKQLQELGIKIDNEIKEN